MMPEITIAFILSMAIAVLIGIIMGLIGAGGTILSVPVMVYLLDIEPEIATVYSLFIVAGTAASGGWAYFRRGWVSFPLTLQFFLPSIPAMFLARKWVLPSIPDILHVSDSGWELSRGKLIMIVFALVMLAAAILMVLVRRPELQEGGPESSGKHVWKYILTGFCTGLLTGFAGSGGGFIIVPALTLIGKVPIRTAIGTSLLIVFLNTAVGFLGEVGNTTMDWGVLLSFTGLTIAGSFAGVALSRKVQGSKLRAGFGWFVLLMGFYILSKELFT